MGCEHVHEAVLLAGHMPVCFHFRRHIGRQLRRHAAIAVRDPHLVPPKRPDGRSQLLCLALRLDLLDTRPSHHRGPADVQDHRDRHSLGADRALG